MTDSPPDPDIASQACETLIVVLDGTETVVPYTAGQSIVQAAYAAGLRPPVSCLMGCCATCVAKIVQGTVAMARNDVLTPDEIARGYTLTCHGLPTAKAVTVVYET